VAEPGGIRRDGEGRSAPLPASQTARARTVVALRSLVGLTTPIIGWVPDLARLRGIGEV